MSIKTIITKIAAITCVAGVLMVANLPLLNAYEAHIINVTAEIKNDIPKINPPEEKFCDDGELVVELSVTLADADIWYTVDFDNNPNDGGDPVCYDHANGSLYTEPFGTGPFPLYDAATVKAVSCHDGRQSAVMSKYYDVSAVYCDPTLLITKVYYDVDSGHYEPCQEWKSEWVEIYNPTSSPVNIKNWEICDNTDCDILSSSDLFIPAGGYAIITGKSTTWKYWDIPAGAVKIVLDSPIGGDGLDNDGDRVILLRSNGNRADAMSYGTDTFIFNPSCPDAAEGNMLGRISLDPGPGYQDTGAASDWKELGLPIISGITAGPLQDEFCGRCNDENYICSSPSDPNCHCAPGSYYKQQMDIAWTMANPVTNDESSVEIVYIIDRDCSGDISSGDLPYYTLETYTLASGASATETYTWIGWTSDDDLLHWDEWKDGWWKDKEGNNVPYFYGFTWIQITASGAENFMIKDSDTSIAMFEPLPPGISFEDRCSILGDSCDECRLGLENYSVTSGSDSDDSSAAGDGSSDDNNTGSAGSDQEETITAKNEDPADMIADDSDDNDNNDNDNDNEEDTDIKEEDGETETEDADDANGGDDTGDEGEDEEIAAKEDDVADAAVDSADGKEDRDDDDEDEDEEIIAREEDIAVDNEASADGGADNLDEGDDEEIGNLELEIGEEEIGDNNNNNNNDDDDDDDDDEEELTPSPSQEGNNSGGGDLPIEDDGGLAEAGFSLTPQV